MESIGHQITGFDLLVARSEPLPPESDYYEMILFVFSKKDKKAWHAYYPDELGFFALDYEDRVHDVDWTFKE